MIIVEEILLCAQNDKNNGFPPPPNQVGASFAGMTSSLLGPWALRLRPFLLVRLEPEYFTGFLNLLITAWLAGCRENILSFSLLVFFLLAFAVRIG